MTDGNDIIVDCDSEHDEVCKGESYKDSYTEKMIDFKKQADIRSVKSSEEVEECANEEGKASQARALTAGINETEGSVAVHKWDASDFSKAVTASLSKNPLKLLRDSPDKIAEYEGYDENSFIGMNIEDILKKGEDIDITIMGYLALLLKIKFGCHVGMLPPAYLFEIARCGTTNQIQKIKSGTNVVQIHYIKDHFVVSAQFDDTLYVCDSLKDEKHLTWLRPQLILLYEKADKVVHVQLQSQEKTRLCGLFAAANAYKLLESKFIPEGTKFIMGKMRQHFHSCLNVEKMKRFTEMTSTLQHQEEHTRRVLDVCNFPEYKDGLKEYETVKQFPRQTSEEKEKQMERINNTDKLKNHETADSFAESFLNITEVQSVQETGDAQDRVIMRPVPPEDFFLDQKENKFKNDVQNHLTFIKEAGDHMLAEESPSSNFLKVCEMMRDNNRKVMDPILYDGYDLKNEGRDVGAYIDQLAMEFNQFSSTVDSLQLTMNNNVNHISRGDSPQRVTEYIENRFGTQTGVHKITHPGYICIYNSERRLGITYEYLTKDNFLGNAKRKTRFKEDDRFEGGFCPACGDFRMNAFHIGHLAASGNYKNSQDKRNDTFNLTNCVPQNTKGNKWEKIEFYTQQLLQKHNKEGALLITGWLMIESLQNGMTSTVTHRKQNTLSVPTHLFKVVITEVENKPEGLAVFIVPNDPNDGISFDRFSAYEKLNIIEYVHGYSLAPKINDKRKLFYLSDHINDHQLDIEYKLFITEKNIRDAPTEEKLDRAYKSLGTIEPSESVKLQYQSRKQDFIKKQKNYRTVSDGECNS